MASILIRQFAGQSVPPTSDAILYENATTGNGVIHGCNCTASDASTIHIDAGYGVIQGRFFEIEDQTISVTLAPSGTLLGQLYIHLDLSDADTPIDIYHEEAASLTAMTQQTGINYSNGIYEIQLCTYNVSTSTISNVTDTFPTLVTTASFGTYDILATTSNTTSTQYTINDISNYRYICVFINYVGIRGNTTTIPVGLYRSLSTIVSAYTTTVGGVVTHYTCVCTYNNDTSVTMSVNSSSIKGYLVGIK